jgi:hypothetical protein
MPNTAFIVRDRDNASALSALGYDVLLFDSTVRESASFQIAITENPVETGVSMADHAYAKPDTLTLEVVVSDTPLLSDGHGTPAIQLAQSQGLAFMGPNERRSVNAWAAIQAGAKSFTIYTVQIGLGSYPNMMIEQGSAEQTIDSAGIMRATLQLHQVTFAGTSKVVYPPRAPKKPARQAAPDANAGKKNADEADTPEERAASWLSQWIGKGA